MDGLLIAPLVEPFEQDGEEIAGAAQQHDDEPERQSAQGVVSLARYVWSPPSVDRYIAVDERGRQRLIGAGES